MSPGEVGRWQTCRRNEREYSDRVRLPNFCSIVTFTSPMIVPAAESVAAAYTTDESSMTTGVMIGASPRRRSYPRTNVSPGGRATRPTPNPSHSTYGSSSGKRSGDRPSSSRKTSAIPPGSTDIRRSIRGVAGQPGQQSEPQADGNGAKDGKKDDVVDAEYKVDDEKK